MYREHVDVGDEHSVYVRPLDVLSSLKKMLTFCHLITGACTHVRCDVRCVQGHCMPDFLAEFGDYLPSPVESGTGVSEVDIAEEYSPELLRRIGRAKWRCEAITHIRES